MQNVRRFVTKVGLDARSDLLAGARYAADAVGRTLGPNGRNWITGVRGGTPHITNDGVSILRELWHPNEIVMLGVRAVREAALKLNEICGDGTTSATVMTYEILRVANMRLGYNIDIEDPASKKMTHATMVGAPNVMDLKRQIDSEAIIVIEALKKMAEPVKNLKEFIGAVRVAVEDPKLAEMIATMQWDLGPQGTILVEDSNERDDEMVKINGIRYDSGFTTSRIINNQEKQSLELEEVSVIMTNATVHALSDFAGRIGNGDGGVIDAVMKNCVANGRSRKLVIIASKFDQVAMKEIEMNFEKGTEIYPIHAPYFNRNQIFKDIAAVLGGTFVDIESGHNLRNMTLSDVGFASKVEATRWNAVFAGITDEKSENRIKQQVTLLEKELRGEKSVFAQDHLTSRISQLKGGIGLLKVGALSEADQKRKHDKIDDAVASARSALQEGLVPGAGLALKMIAEEVLPEDAVLREPLASIHQYIVANSGTEFTIEPWVKDPVKVVRLVVEKAASIAGNIVTAEGAIDHENPKPRYVEETSKAETGE